MNAVKDNPFRVLGLFADCSERELVRQVSHISRYAEIGKSIEYPSDFLCLGEISRDPVTVAAAAAKLEQPLKKLHWAAFWFVRGNHIDDTAFGHLRTGNIDKAVEILSLAIKDDRVTSKNWSSALNLSTLQIGVATSSRKFDREMFKMGINLKGKVFESDEFESLSRKLVGRNAAGRDSSFEIGFVDEVVRLIKPFLNRSPGLTTRQLISAFVTFSNGVKSHLIGQFTAGPIQRIEREIAETKQLRVDDPGNADTFGIDLYTDVNDDLSELESAIGKNGVQFQILVNKVAQEILQCSIDYFNEHVADYELDDEDPGPGAMGLIELARLLEPTGEVKHRLDENAPIIEEWVNEAADREAHLQVKRSIAFVDNALRGFQSLIDSPATALQLMSTCKPKIDQIGFILGKTDEVYLGLSDAVVNNAVGMTIAAINAVREKAPLSFGDPFDYRLALLKNCLADGAKVLALVTEFDMSSELRSRCEANRVVLAEIMGQIGMGTAAFQIPSQSKSQPSPRASGTGTDSGRKPRPLVDLDAGAMPLSSYAENTDIGLGRRLGRFLGGASPTQLVFWILGVIIIAVLTKIVVVDNPGPSVTKQVVSTPTPLMSGNANIATAVVPAPSATPLPKTERPKSGTVLNLGSKRGGYGQLLISNGTPNDALVRLIDVSIDKTYREIYVRANSAASITGIAAGNYDLLFTTGQDYAPSIKKFLRDSDYSKFGSQLNFVETWSDGGVGFKKFEVTLNPVAHGNTSITKIDESAFDR